jgi:hypothetical protein
MQCIETETLNELPECLSIMVGTGIHELDRVVGSPGFYFACGSSGTKPVLLYHRSRNRLRRFSSVREAGQWLTSRLEQRRGAQ